MNVKKEVYEKCKNMINREISDAKYKLMINRRKINDLSKEQRILKSEIGKLHETVKLFN